MEMIHVLILATVFQAAPQQDAGRTAEPQQRGPVVMITGSTDGLGREVARRMAATGAHVIVHGRNKERGEALVAEIKQGGKGSAAFYAADLSSLAEVRKLGQAILRDYDRINVLVNNAGVWVTRGERQMSADGHEMHFAVNYLAGYLLTDMLKPRLISGAPSRIRKRRFGRADTDRLRQRQHGWQLQRRPRLRPEQARSDHARLRSRA